MAAKSLDCIRSDRMDRCWMKGVMQRSSRLHRLQVFGSRCGHRSFGGASDMHSVAQCTLRDTD
eukprot:6145855-Alexandrium_andersonii.AAC.1